MTVSLVPLLTSSALTLYLDFLNLFLSVLRVVSQKQRRRDCEPDFS